MRHARIGFAIVVICVVALSLGADAPPPAINAGNVSTFYQNYKRLTKQPRQVGARQLTLCAPPRQNQAEQTYGPHAHGFVNLYASPNAEKTIAAGPKAIFPEGSVIIKEKLAADKSVIAVGGMVKRAAGYDKEHGDWEYFYYAQAPGFSSGKLSNCVNCHSAAKDSDHVYSVWNLQQ